MMNIVNGGSHSDAPIAFQEFMILPLKIDFKLWKISAPQRNASLNDSAPVGKIMNSWNAIGASAPKFEGTEDAVETIIKAIEKAGYKPGEDVFLGFDCASSLWKISAPQRNASLNDSAPVGKIMNSWNAIGASECLK
jgi:enolase